jgi:hypothetical protein
MRAAPDRIVPGPEDPWDVEPGTCGTVGSCRVRTALGARPARHSM